MLTKNITCLISSKNSANDMKDQSEKNLLSEENLKFHEPKISIIPKQFIS